MQLCFTFIRLWWSEYGGAIFIDEINHNVNIDSNFFHSCSATSIKESSGRKENIISGGAYYLDVNSLKISNLLFTLCKSPGSAHCIYYCLPESTQITVNCISDFLSGNSSAIRPTNFLFDRGILTLRDLNISQPFLDPQSQTGSLHIGLNISESSIKYCNFIIRPQHSNMAIGLSVSSCYISSCHIENSIASSESGIIGLWEVQIIILMKYIFLNAQET